MAAVLLTAVWVRSATTYYASPAGSGSTCSFASPCSLRTLLTTCAADDTCYLRGGTYNGKFASAASGTSGHPITFLTYPGEAAVIDGYLATTLTTAITTTNQSTLSLATATGFPVGAVITIDDQSDPAACEQLSLAGGTAPNYTNVQRGWNGTTAQTHLNGATAIIGGNQMDVSGSYQVWKGIRFTHSFTKRTQIPANSQNGPFIRGEGVFNTGDFNSFINCVFDNNQDGLFNSQLAVGTVVYGCVIFNNGYVAGGAYNGHGLYLIHEDVSNTAFIKENIIFNNSNIGIKGDSQNGDTVNIWNEGNISFNSGSWETGTGNKFNLLMASNNGISTLITVKDNYLFHKAGQNATNFKLGLGGASNGTLSMTGNVVAHGIPVSIEKWSPLTFTGNTVWGTNNTGGGNNTIMLFEPHSSPSSTFNNNTYFNQITSALGYYPTNASSSSSFSTWKSTTGFDAASTQSTSAPSTLTFVRANAYDGTILHVAIYNPSGGASVNVDFTGLIGSGQTYSIYAAENYFGAAVASGTYTSGNVAVPMNGTTVVSPVGADESAIHTPVTMRPQFGALNVVVGAASGGGSIGGAATLSGGAKIQ